MVPEGFVSWDSPIKPDGQQEIVVLRNERQVVRGVAQELARLYGDSILAWRRESGFPPIMHDESWRRFPEETPAHGQCVVAAFVDTIGWRALGRAGMGERRFEPTVIGTCIYRAIGQFGTFVQRVPLTGRQAIGDVRRWAVSAWKPTLGPAERSGG